MRRKYKPRQRKLISQGVLDSLEAHRRRLGLNKKDFAAKIGIPNSTLRDIISKETGSGKSLEKLMSYLKVEVLKEKNISEISRENTGLDLVDTEITGNEVSCINQMKMRLLLNQVQFSSNLLISALKVFANSDVGSRRILHENFGLEIQELHILSKALSSESMLKIVQNELGKKELP